MNKVIERYTTPELGAIFSDVSRMSTWLDVEVAVADALSAVGKVSKEDIETIHKTRPTIDQNFVNDVLEREAITHHDGAAFVDTVQSKMGNDAARYIHYGLTSSDVVDTALSVLLKRSMIIILEEAEKLDEALLTIAN